jgi:hypothetical protein
MMLIRGEARQHFSSPRVISKSCDIDGKEAETHDTMYLARRYSGGHVLIYASCRVAFIGGAYLTKSSVFTLLLSTSCHVGPHRVIAGRDSTQLYRSDNRLRSSKYRRVYILRWMSSGILYILTILPVHSRIDNLAEMSVKISVVWKLSYKATTPESRHHGGHEIEHPLEVS